MTPVQLRNIRDHMPNEVAKLLCEIQPIGPEAQKAMADLIQAEIEGRFNLHFSGRCCDSLRGYAGRAPGVPSGHASFEGSLMMRKIDGPTRS